MTDQEKKADIEDKRKFYEEARAKMLIASERATKAEVLARVERDFANRMSEEVNRRLRELNDAMK